MYKICIPQIYKVKLVNWWKKSLKSYHNQEAHLDPHQTSMMKLLYENNERFLVKISSIKYVKWVLNTTHNSEMDCIRDALLNTFQRFHILQ